MPALNRRALLFAAAACVAAMTLGGGLFPAVGVFGTWRLASTGWRLWQLAGSGQFHAVGRNKDVLRFDLWWRPLPVALVPLSVTLIREGSNYYLIDAGGGDNWSQSYASRLTAALQRTMPKGGRLAGILLTHGHPDHVGALPQLLQAYPDTPVIFHSLEAPFLLGDEEYLPPGSPVLRLLRALGITPAHRVKVPQSRAVLLHGSDGGSLSGHGIASLSWIATPGHSPGHISYMHRPSGILIAGDALFNVFPSAAFASGIEGLVTRPLGFLAGRAARLALGPAQSVLSSVLGGRWPVPVPAALNATLGGLSTERLTSGALAVLSGAGGLGVSVMPASSGVGKELGTFRLMRFLPGVTVRISPSFLCPKPRCDVAQGEASICRIAEFKYDLLLPSHDATGKGLSPADAGATFPPHPQPRTPARPGRFVQRMARLGAQLAALLLLAAMAPCRGTKLQWNVTGDYVNFPFASPYPPYVIRTTEGTDPDRIVLVSGGGGSGGQWALTAYAADTGSQAWTSTVTAPDASNAGLTTLTSGLPHWQQLNNSLGLMFMQLGKYVVAVDAASGQQRWQHATYNASTPKITGYSGPGGPARVYLTSSFVDSTRAVPVPVNYIEALDPATGQVVWANFTSLPPASGLPTSDTAGMWGVTATPTAAVYAQGARLYGLSPDDGRQLWQIVVSAGAGTGLNPNVTSVAYVPVLDAVPSRQYPMLLMTSSTWDQTRFMAYQLNGSSASAAPTVAWQTSGNTNFEGSLNEQLKQLGLQVPQVSVVDGVFVFWSNRTSYELGSGKPVYNTYLVGRSLKDGGIIWAANMSALGYSKLPVSPPVINVGVAAVTTSQELVVFDAGSGFMRWGQEAAPYQPQATGGQYSYVPVTSFANDWGHLAAVRCLGDQQPGSLTPHIGSQECAAGWVANNDTAGPAAKQPAPSGTLWGAISLITGSTVGAGMLALPAVSAPAGIAPTSAALVGIWVLLTLDALLMAEVNLAARTARDAAAAAAADDGSSGATPAGDVITLRQMAEFSLGKAAGRGLTLVYLALAYSLLTAYATKAAEVLDYLSGGGLPPLLPAAAFVGGIGSLLYLGGTRTIDAINQGLTSVLLALFAVILCAGAGQSSLPHSLLHGASDWSAVQPAVPIIFLSLVFHDLTPVIVSYLGGDRARIRTALVLGSLVPLGMFLSWEAVALSLLPSGLADAPAAASVMEAALQLAPGAEAPLAVDAAVSLDAAAAGLVADTSAVLAVDPLEVFVRRAPPLIGRLVETFSFLAVGTSFIGTTLSLSETLRTEVPPLLNEVSKQLKRFTGVETSSLCSGDASDDELSCLRTGFRPSEGAGCSATWAPGAQGPACSLDDAPVAAAPVAAASSSSSSSSAADTGGLPLDGHAVALLLTLCPPLALAANNPDNFLGALEFAGAYFMTLLFGILPPVMAWQLRRKAQSRREQQPGARRAALEEEEAAGVAQPWWQQHADMVPGGAPLLAGLFSVALAIQLSKLAADAGLTSEGGGFVQPLVEAALKPSELPGAVLALLHGTAPL
ncbi:tyrosine-specific transport -like [Chlorella sorokiniana]|uniref:Tyrosine-specific transport-like n=1 Tax=Chlorella sorokiniana TaxID=3076 RepID=A0A2P6TD13_CHLSO|nr:tyrosine-specific transport -like [Chlorella sorokiniana]|eukprot:PRW20529.1 tyrosine-specific transport -like [Chlorella sorokiniana]